MTTENKVSLWYCPTCEGLLFHWKTMEIQHGEGHYFIDAYGKNCEEEFYSNTITTEAYFCCICDTTLCNQLVIPFSLFKRFVGQSEDNDNINTDIFYIKLNDIANITDENLIEKLAEGLL
jgi:hypothetical protein